MPAEVDVAIIGAGVIGLAIADEIAKQQKTICIFEKNHSFGLETSSRNSEVIHAGLYYPLDSLKTKLCIEGRDLLHELCPKTQIPYKKLGKIIVAQSEEEIGQLEILHRRGIDNGITDLTLLSRSDLKSIEPNISGTAGLLSPSTGVIDSHSLMQFFYQNSLDNGAKFLFDTTVVGLEKTGDGFKVQISDWEGVTTLTSRVVINSGGLNADEIAQFAGIDVDQANYKLHYCKGDYFSLSSKWKNKVGRLIYPSPETAGLGIHLTLSLDGRMRLGPGIHYADKIDYKVDITQKAAFYESAKEYLPFIEKSDLQPDFSGIRPKLQAPLQPFRDFVITGEQSNGLPGLINLIGMESPGLTASPAIARYVNQLVHEILD